MNELNRLYIKTGLLPSHSEGIAGHSLTGNSGSTPVKQQLPSKFDTGLRGIPL